MPKTACEALKKGRNRMAGPDAEATGTRQALSEAFVRVWASPHLKTSGFVRQQREGVGGMKGFYLTTTPGSFINVKLLKHVQGIPMGTSIRSRHRPNRVPHHALTPSPVFLKFRSPGQDLREVRLEGGSLSLSSPLGLNRGVKSLNGQVQE